MRLMSIRGLGANPSTSPIALNDSSAGATQPASGLLRRGDRGPEVTALQERLRSAGQDIEADGVFGPKTEQAVRAFQKTHGAQVDGVVGPETRGALDRALAQDANGAPRTAPNVNERRPEGAVRVSDLRPPPITTPPRGSSTASTRTGEITLPPKGASEAEQYRHFEGIVRANGGEIRPGERHVLAIRGLDRNGQTHDGRSSHAMNDSYAVLWKDANGNGHVRQFAGSTHPGQTRSSLSPDVNRDGVGDVGRIREGTYRASANGDHNGAPSFHVTAGGSGRISGVRDTNHDGVFSAEEDRASRARGDTMSEILLHRPADNGNVRSIGCMNVADWNGFVSAVGGRGASFDFTLVNANR
ncbi:MAG: peptidoglycan-binding protein [Deltaproteobacteria bacterium]|nr:peptidoglycan-binding protein [Deltaproteobacteria bacterium]